MLALSLAAPATPGHAVNDAALIDGFARTIFGSEFPTFGGQAHRVKKFTRPVRFYIDDRSRDRRGGQVLAFIRSLPRQISGLQASVVSDPRQANFRVFVIDRIDYRRIVMKEVYGGLSSGFAPGKCLVRVTSGRNGIERSDAVIVADEGDFLFKRCLVEEILQGLGPINDDVDLPESVFNDTSRHSSFTHFDRMLLNMLYHPRIRHGMRKDAAEALLPTVLADIRRRN
ncbi:MAG TPA: DUF2927 domain-containing protein [Propylenella sp.]|nr:DUF2927 domain-containing protein [Propylenella sp.]